MAKPKLTDTEYGAPTWAQSVLIRYRRVIGFLIPAAFFHFFWWALAIKYSYWQLFPEKYAMVITMIFGSVFAGRSWVLCVSLLNTVSALIIERLY